MEIFIKAENYQVWRVIEVGDFEVSKINSNNEVIPKPMSEFEKEGDKCSCCKIASLWTWTT